MTRNWTLGELNRVHPLPEGWVWSLNGSDPVATSGDLEVLADADVYGRGRESAMSSIPVDVALSVILASKGLDSFESMARAMDEEERNLRQAMNEMARPGSVLRFKSFYLDGGSLSIGLAGEALGFRRCAEMLRHGIK